MNGYVIYADILLALNWILDFFLLWASGCFLKRRILLRRIIPAASLGAIYGAAVICPLPPWLFHIVVAGMVSLLMLLIAFPWQGIHSFLRLVAAFYLISFSMAGAALAGGYLLGYTGYAFGAIQTLKVSALIFGLIFGLMIARKGFLSIRRSWRKEEFRTEIEISFLGHSCRANALIDTCNDLREPISGLPVVVADKRVLLPLMPESFQEAFQKNNGDPVRLAQEYFANHQDAWHKSFRLIPFTSIGQQHGLLLGFKPDSLRLYDGHQTRDGNAVVCIATNGLSTGEYRAILNPEVFEYPLSQEASA